MFESILVLVILETSYFAISYFVVEIHAHSISPSDSRDLFFLFFLLIAFIAFIILFNL